MSENASVTITQKSNYQFLVDFGAGIPHVLADEPVPLGAGEGPSPNQLLLAAVTNCLSASLFFALNKFKQDAGGITTTGTAIVGRDADKRLRVNEIDVTIRLGKPGGDIEHLDRILAQFEAFCTVTQSVRHGIPVVIAVEDGQGVRVDKPAP
ncbi:MAG: OsmC family protein [Proteobacteria bacterium]|nr:OsmC family protein [Pseudomonadota bacterium]